MGTETETSVPVSCQAITDNNFLEIFLLEILAHLIDILVKNIFSICTISMVYTPPPFKNALLEPNFGRIFNA